MTLVTLKGIHPNPTELKRLATDAIKSETITDFDLYVSVGGYMVLYAPGPYRWTDDEVGRLMADGHGEVFYTPVDEGKVSAYKKIVGLPEIDINQAPKIRLISISDVAAEFSRILYENPFTEAAVVKGQEIADATIRCVKQDLACVQALGLLAQSNQYTYYHSGRVAAYAIAIAIKLGINDDLALQNLGLGCLLHDIGKSKLDAHIVNKAGPLSEHEWKVMRQHPLFGYEMVEKSKLSLVPLEIILHHHERMDGRGYPHGLSKTDILEEVSLAAFADVFDALTSNKPWSTARTRFEALDFIRFHMLDQISQDAYKAMVEILCLDQSPSSLKVS